MTAESGKKNTFRSVFATSKDSEKKGYICKIVKHGFTVGFCLVWKFWWVDFYVEKEKALSNHDC